jgi:hypothetical protein
MPVMIPGLISVCDFRNHEGKHPAHRRDNCHHLDWSAIREGRERAG